jgi:hypothetical protein
MVEGDAGAGEGVLHEVGDAAGVPVGGDGDGAGVARGGEGGAHVLGDAVRVAAARDLAVLDVPPDRGLGGRVLPHRRRPPAPVSQAQGFLLVCGGGGSPRRRVRTNLVQSGVVEVTSTFSPFGR